MDVEVVEAEPPKAVYGRCLDLQLAKHYALPICPLGGNMDLNPVDGIVGALSGDIGALEVIACGDPKAKLGIRKYIYERTHRKASMTKAFTDIAVGVLAEAKSKSITFRRVQRWLAYFATLPTERPKASKWSRKLKAKPPFFSSATLCLARSSLLG
ncbi:MAG: hypothetical protein ACTSYQ_03490 [Candidatus Odinarchaeia archaeon]